MSVKGLLSSMSPEVRSVYKGMQEALDAESRPDTEAEPEGGGSDNVPARIRRTSSPHNGLSKKPVRIHRF